MASLCLALFAGWSGGRKRVRQNSVPKQPTWRLCTGCKGGRELGCSGRCRRSPRLLCAASGNKRPIWRETGSAWAPYFLFIEFVPGKSERGGVVWCSLIERRRWWRVGKHCLFALRFQHTHTHTCLHSCVIASVLQCLWQLCPLICFNYLPSDTAERKTRKNRQGKFFKWPPEMQLYSAQIVIFHTF